MGVSLSIKDVPEALAERLRLRAARHHRSLQRELMAIVEAAAAPGAWPALPAGTSESEPVYALATATRSAPAGDHPDDLLTELDAIVAGSQWGQAPMLSREQAHDRVLAREFDFDARSDELARARHPLGTRGAP